MERWTAEQYARAAHVPLRTAQYRLRRWHDTGRVRVVREDVPATGSAPPRTRYLLDVASWREAAGIAA
jgi:hypothetical protein